MNGNKKKKPAGIFDDEVEEMLRAAEDAALLKLSINSHTVHPSSSDLHPDLDQRYKALKSGPKSCAKPGTSTKRISPPQASEVKEEVVQEDDLFTRFAALKASLPSSSPSTVSSSSAGPNTSDVSKLGGGSSVGKANINDDDDEEDEVEKVIRWAMDAARLDPSLPSDDDDEEEDSEISDEEDYSRGKNKKGHCK